MIMRNGRISVNGAFDAGASSDGPEALALIVLRRRGITGRSFVDLPNLT